MSPEQMGELLTRLDERSLAQDEKIDRILKHAENGGWARCRVNNKRLESIETTLKERKAGIVWRERAIWGSIIGLIITRLWNPATEFLSHLLSHFASS